MNDQNEKQPALNPPTHPPIREKRSATKLPSSGETLQQPPNQPPDSTTLPPWRRYLLIGIGVAIFGIGGMACQSGPDSGAVDEPGPAEVVSDSPVGPDANTAIPSPTLRLGAFSTPTSTDTPRPTLTRQIIAPSITPRPTVDGAVLGLNLIELVKAMPTNLAQICVDGVLWASGLGSGNQQILTTGTVTHLGNGDVQYDAAPNDRLRIAFRDANFYCMISHLDGDLSRNSVEFLQNDHLFIASASSDIPGQEVNLAIGLRDQGNSNAIEMSGDLNYGGATYAISLTETGQFQGESSFGGGEFTSQRSLEGTVENLGLSMQIDESNGWEMVTHDGESASFSTTAINNTWQVGGDTFQYSARINRSFRDGSPSRLDSSWLVQGGLSRNNQPYGQLTADNDGTFLTILLRLPNMVFEIEEWRL